MTTADIQRKITSIEWAIRQTYANRRCCHTALTDIREYIRTIRAFKKALSPNQ